MFTSANDTDDAHSWIARKYFDEISLQFRTAWDIYIKWYTVFLTANVVALGATVQYVDKENRLVIAAAFCVQNILAIFTAIYLSIFSRRTAERIRMIASIIASECDQLKNSAFFSRLGSPPIPGDLAFWSGVANALGNTSLIACWIATLFIG